MHHFFGVPCCRASSFDSNFITEKEHVRVTDTFPEEELEARSSIAGVGGVLNTPPIQHGKKLETVSLP